ncbi:MAG: FtsX-like permease family protein, partial [Candidatus Thermoplasmatota archaeon]
SIGETVYLGVTKLSTSVLFRVCDIVEPTFEYPTLKSITLHLSELQYITRTKNDTVSEILVELHEPSKAKELKNRIEKNFVCSPYIQEDFYNEINKYTKVFEGFSNMIVIITSLVTVVFIGTIMVISVREMACEFGALRAMGISKKTIYKFVLAQSFTICVIGSAIGLFIGYFGTNLLDTYIKSIYHQLPKSIHIALLTPFVIAEITIFAIIIGTISGLIPSILVSRMKIADVIRGE